MARSRRQAGLGFILVTLFLDILGIGIIIPVLPELVTDFVGGDASRAAPWYGVIIASFALMQFLFAPLLGALSDRFGRRPVLLIALGGFGVNYVMLALAPSLWWLWLARILSGICGASVTTGNAYIADISTPETRARNFGLAGAMFGLGFVFGPALGGLLGHVSPRMPFWVSAGIVGVNWLYGLFILPESLPPDQRRPFSLREGNPLGGVRLLKRYPVVYGLAFVFLFMSLAQRGLESVWVLYTHYRYGWQELQNGLTLAMLGIAAVFVQGVLVRRVVPRIGERRAIVFGIVVMLVGNTAYGLATEGWMIVVIIVIASLGGIAGPAVQSLVAEIVPSSEQGGVQGALTSMVSLTAIVAPLIASMLFGAFTGEGAPVHMPGAPFFLGAVFSLIAIAIALRTFERHY